MDDLSRQIGGLLLTGLSGPSLTGEERRFIRKVSPCAVIYFRRNAVSPRQLAGLSEQVWRVSGLPPLIGIDQEGGRVARLGHPFTVFPGNDFLGRIHRRTSSPSKARLVARAMADELRAVGVNLNFTPVADVHSNPANPIIGSRSFGKSPSAVAELVAVTVRAYRSAGVIGCAKHFPGHGDTSLDSHKALPVVTASNARLWRREIPPFCAAIRAGVPALMTAHVVYPAFDACRAATLSPFILGDLLRARLGFRGVLFSDDMEMGAIAASGDVPDSCVEAVRAGVDAVLICRSLHLAEEVYEAFHRAISRDEAFRRRAVESLDRIRALKRVYLRAAYRRPGEIPLKCWDDHRALARAVEAEGAKVRLKALSVRV